MIPFKNPSKCLYCSSATWISPSMSFFKLSISRWHSTTFLAGPSKWLWLAAEERTRKRVSIVCNSSSNKVARLPNLSKILSIVILCQFHDCFRFWLLNWLWKFPGYKHEVKSNFHYSPVGVGSTNKQVVKQILYFFVLVGQVDWYNIYHTMVADITFVSWPACKKIQHLTGNNAIGALLVFGT